MKNHHATTPAPQNKIRAWPQALWLLPLLGLTACTAPLARQPYPGHAVTAGKVAYLSALRPAADPTEVESGGELKLVEILDIDGVQAPAQENGGVEFAIVPGLHSVRIKVKTSSQPKPFGGTGVSGSTATVLKFHAVAGRHYQVQAWFVGSKAPSLGQMLFFGPAAALTPDFTWRSHIIELETGIEFLQPMLRDGQKNTIPNVTP